MNRINYTARGLFFFAFLLFFGFALLIPVYFNALSINVLKSYVKNTKTMDVLVEDYLKEEKIGVARLLFQSVDKDNKDSNSIRNILEKKPDYFFSDGPAPVFLSFISAIKSQRNNNLEAYPAQAQTPSAIALLLPREHHDSALRILKESKDGLTGRLLSTQQLRGYEYFKPVNNIGGFPLKTTILMTGLLSDEARFSPLFHDKFSNLTQSALSEKNPFHTSSLEEVYIGLATLGKRLSWAQLAELVTFFNEFETLQKTAEITRRYPENLPLLYASILLSEQIDRPLNYIEKYGDKAWKGIEIGINVGKKSLLTLWEKDKPVYPPPSFLQDWSFFFPTKLVPSFLVTLSAQQPLIALILKVIIFLFASFFLTMVFVPSFSKEKLLQTLPLQIAIAAVLSVFLWLLIESHLYPTPQEKTSSPSESLVFDLSKEFRFNNNLAKNNFNTMFDFSTLFTLLGFFLSQIVVYLYNLMQLKQIKHQEITPSLKIKLIENDENLFDLGLYVGLGGTVLSLILLALGIKEVSLIAAYSSTLFGIIFVAILKIFHLRPLRQKLILKKK